ncbi:Streptogramin A acetyltransferase [Buttiauxella agrestis]|uniref:Streptogramin A acetyltransferase n=1 Tax=Buttiauxella agrestis TaxID=82977 RepID=A0A381C800_9ENTR|nr:CatB-related O-acetyltransferase [Buttiauxella agrestis]SUW63083.1 Streptogramin A acetyltransferase [Buttiauxella agrestis]
MFFSKLKRNISILKTNLKSTLYKNRNKSTSFGKRTILFSPVTITNSVIGDYTYFAGSAHVNNTTIGKFCSIADDVRIGLGTHPINLFSTHPIFYSNKSRLPYILGDINYALAEKIKINETKPINIGNDVWIGVGAIIIDGVNIGDGAIIGAGSIVTKDVSSYTIVAGVPAKVINHRNINHDKWWDYNDEQLIEYVNTMLAKGMFEDV